MDVPLGTLTIGTARLVADLSFFVLCLSPAVGESLIPLNVKTIKRVLLVQQKYSEVSNKRAARLFISHVLL